MSATSDLLSDDDIVTEPSGTFVDSHGQRWIKVASSDQAQSVEQTQDGSPEPIQKTTNICETENGSQSRIRTNTQQANSLLYGVEDSLPLPMLLLCGFQAVMVSASGIISAPLVIVGLICAKFDLAAKTYLISTMLVTSGFSTILQSLVGVRLPLLQGPSYSFLPPIFILMKSNQYQCPAELLSPEYYMANNTRNISLDEVWMERMTFIQGGLVTAALVQMLFGLTGIIGLLTRFIGPLTIAPLMLLVQYQFVRVIMVYLTLHWIVVIQFFLLLLFAVYMNGILVPLPSFSKSRGFHQTRIPIFGLFPYVLSLAITWTLCLILTKSGVISVTSPASTDLKQAILYDSPWIRFPYPGQWGPPRVTVAVFFGMLAGTIASVLESIGDYHACARICQAPPVPPHAVNRGIFVEGFACFIGGLLGGGTSVTTYSENIGVIGITRVASRSVMLCAGILFIVLGLITKIGAIFAAMPDPLVGGILFVSLAMLGGVGLSNLHTVDLRLSRNMAVLGLAILCGFIVPRIFKFFTPKTGNDTFDLLVETLSTNEMIVGGVAGFFLDNTVPGATKLQRGIVSSNGNESPGDIAGDQYSGSAIDVYSFPDFVMELLERIPYYYLIPVAPPPRHQRNQNYKNREIIEDK